MPELLKDLETKLESLLPPALEGRAPDESKLGS